MDRDRLNYLLALLFEKSLKVDVEGMIFDDKRCDHFHPQDVVATINEMRSELDALAAFVAWAKTAPLYKAE